ncbi:hypothetical protein AX16_001905 [Volvariella volvacea WC 439]|nr:hypothetical protein AX16_001905 [Volvariella volvacea WC 439]
MAPFPLSRESQSPPRDGGIRLPNAPLSDIASLQQPGVLATATSPPRKAHTTPYYSPPATNLPQDYFQSPIPQAQEIASAAATNGTNAWQGDLTKEGATNGSNSSLMQGPLPTTVAS